MTSDDIVVLVFTSALNLHERALACQNTWLGDFKYGYLIGGNYIDKKLKMLPAGDFIGEDYASASDKQYYGLKKLYEMYPDKKWYFITGCDAYIFSKNLIDVLSTFDCKKDLYIGGDFTNISVCGSSYLLPRGGPGFALSNSLVKKIVTNFEKIISKIKTFDPWLQAACDWTLCYFVNEWFGVKPTYIKGLYDWPPYRYPSRLYGGSDGKPCVTKIEKFPIAFHRLSIREFYILANGQQLKKNFIMLFLDKIQRKISLKFRTKSLFNRVFYKQYKRNGFYQ